MANHLDGHPSPPPRPGVAAHGTPRTAARAPGFRLLLLPLLLVVAACGAETSPEAAPTTPPATTTPAPAPTAATPPPVETRYFSSQSGAIRCSMSAVATTCEVKDHKWKLPSKPADCDVDWGGMVEVRADEGTLVCHGDTLFGTGPVPELGESLTVGDFQCRPAKVHVYCTNLATKHGFSVSRWDYQLG